MHLHMFPLLKMFSGHALVHATKQSPRRRRWVTFVRANGQPEMKEFFPPKLGVTRWCAWRDCADWWRPVVLSWKKFLAHEVERSPWQAKQPNDTPPLLHHTHELLHKRFHSLSIRLAFVSDHSQGLSESLHFLQASKRTVAPFVYDMVMNIRTEFASPAMEGSKFSPCVEELLSKLRDPKPLQSLLRKALQRAVDYIDQIMEKNKTQ